MPVGPPPVVDPPCAPRSPGPDGMLKVAATRLLAVIPLMVVVSFLAFVLQSLNPVDPAEQITGGTASREAIAQLRHELGIDRPVVVRYGDWLGGALHGDLGASVYTKDAKVTRSLLDRLPVTLSLTFGGLLVALLLGLPAGIYSALRAGRRGDRVVSGIASIGQAAPNFWIAALLALFLSVKLRWFPAVFFVGPSSSITGWLRSITLPSIALGLAGAAALARQTRSAMIGVLQLDYVRTALALGARRREVVYKHALKNAAVPLVTVLSFQLTALLGGSFAVERVFALPGIGDLAINAVLRNDGEVVVGFVVLVTLFVVLVNLVLDLSYRWLNPKVRVS